MGEKRKYELEGLVIEIPIHYDKQAEMYIEDYPDFIENPTYTPKGNRVLFAGTDACPLLLRRLPAAAPIAAPVSIIKVLQSIRGSEYVQMN